MGHKLHGLKNFKIEYDEKHKETTPRTASNTNKH